MNGAGGGHGTGRIFNLEHVVDGSDAADGFLSEGAQLEGQRAGELAVEVDGAAAHACDDAGFLGLLAQQANENYVFLGPDGIVENADDFQVHGLDLIALEDGVGHAVHSRLDVAQEERSWHRRGRGQATGQGKARRHEGG